MAYQYGFGIIRVDEPEESLSSLRSLFRDVEPEQSYVSVLNFEDGEAVKQHDMAALAKVLYYYPASPPAPPAAQEGSAAPTAAADADAAELFRILNQS